jgi:hypothetical protein
MRTAELGVPRPVRLDRLVAGRRPVRLDRLVAGRRPA